jgi:hypothetical protein
MRLREGRFQFEVQGPPNHVAAVAIVRRLVLAAVAIAVAIVVAGHGTGGHALLPWLPLP